MDHEPDYSRYALHELLDAAARINREKYRDRAQRIDQEIAGRSEENKASLETASIAEKIERRMQIIRRIYAGLALLGGIAIFFAMLGLPRQHPPIEALEGALTVFVYTFIYYGLKGKKSWVIPLLLIMAAFILTTSFLSILRPANSPSSFLGKIVDSAYVLFAAYQIYLFKRKEVRDLFGSKGKILM